uniref:Uncharacterized protein n=1 Tax=Heterorhabditis bacteriophora TaxID=37862 RepID=A0A1I7WB59_HETBA
MLIEPNLLLLYSINEEQCIDKIFTWRFSSIFECGLVYFTLQLILSPLVAIASGIYKYSAGRAEEEEKKGEGDLIILNINRNCFTYIKITVALRITSNKLHRGNITIDCNSLLNDLLSILIKASVSASNCGSSLYNFLSSIRNKRLHLLLMNCCFLVSYSVRSHQSWAYQKFLLNFGKTRTQNEGFIIYLLPIASLLIGQ